MNDYCTKLCQGLHKVSLTLHESYNTASGGEGRADVGQRQVQLLSIVLSQPTHCRQNLEFSFLEEQRKLHQLFLLECVQICTFRHLGLQMQHLLYPLLFCTNFSFPRCRGKQIKNCVLYISGNIPREAQLISSSVTSQCSIVTEMAGVGHGLQAPQFLKSKLWAKNSTQVASRFPFPNLKRYFFILFNSLMTVLKASKTTSHMEVDYLLIQHHFLKIHFPVFLVEIITAQKLHDCTH